MVNAVGNIYTELCVMFTETAMVDTIEKYTQSCV